MTESLSQARKRFIRESKTPEGQAQGTVAERTRQFIEEQRTKAMEPPPEPPQDPTP